MKLRGIVEFYDRMGIEYFKEYIFQNFNISSQKRWKFLSDSSSFHQLHNDRDYKEYRACNPLISQEKIWEIEQLLETESIESQSYI